MKCLELLLVTIQFFFKYSLYFLLKKIFSSTSLLLAADKDALLDTFFKKLNYFNRVVKADETCSAD